MQLTKAGWRAVNATKKSIVTSFIFFSVVPCFMYSFFFRSIHCCVFFMSHLCNGSKWIVVKAWCSLGCLLGIRILCLSKTFTTFSTSALSDLVECALVVAGTSDCFNELIHMLIIEITRNVPPKPPLDVHKSVPLHLVGEVRREGGIDLELEAQCFQGVLDSPIILKVRQEQFPATQHPLPITFSPCISELHDQAAIVAQHSSVVVHSVLGVLCTTTVESRIYQCHPVHWPDLPHRLAFWVQMR